MKKKNTTLIALLLTITLLILSLVFSKNLPLGTDKIVSIALSILVGYLISRLIWKNKLALLENCCDVIEKDRYDVSISGSGASKDIHRVNHNLSKLFNTSKESYKSTLKTSVQVAQSMEYLNETIKEMEVATEQIASSTENLAEGATEQIQSLNEIINSLDIIYNDLESIANKSLESVENAEDSFKNAQEGKALMGETKKTIEKVNQLTTTLLSLITDLNTQTASIANFVNTISDISDSTNLLALNSSIEAARAGEHGKGFAVVAREIGSLAEESQRASKDIENILNSTGTKLRELSTILKDNAEEVSKSMEIVKKTNSSFENIESSAFITKEGVRNISDYVNKIKKSGEAIISSTSGIQSVSEANAAGSQQLSAMIQEISASFKDIVSSTESLLEEANLLQQSSASTAMEGYMYHKALELIDVIGSKALDSAKLKELAKSFKIDDIYIVDKRGIIVNSSESQAINLDSFKIDPVSKEAAGGKAPYLATPIRKRVEDNQMYKFLHVPYNGGVLTVSLSLESLLNM
ncbi:methyl-accepting chemotaxis sensory transducer with Pas/Pac sensor [Proteiniborus ethanoligenes]|uniref:Methyl-accepting chemotaxis sensory transducer with Pas/Pac sensor n=1 Tax=Proteiniborus ethanoligenes TaxID=415015 RepID=A0A1H3MK48_9FIRM|nr:methyl-accepting chemotaxis protein [Proteiniborus ethanoligenes]SDY76798.1 methyl-accepting chemotaxis sensory transducer with Pas/Pac sensor [Proteiniborus ethanoligenes]